MDSGYESYQDARLQPPDETEMTPAECHENCIHAKACARIVRGVGEVFDAALELGCGDCEEYDDGACVTHRSRERIDALRSECARLLGIVRMAESENDVCYVNHEFTERLRSLGVEVRDE